MLPHEGGCLREGVALPDVPEVGLVYVRTFDPLNRVLRSTNPDSQSLTLLWDPANRREARIDPDGGRVTNLYDNAGRCTVVIDADAGRTTYSYDNANRETSVRLPNGTRNSLIWDAAGQMTQTSAVKSGGTLVSSFTYTYDPAGNRTSVVDLDGDRTTWSYDPTNQLTEENRTGANAWRHTFTYDPVGNRTIKNADGTVTTSTYDAANRLLTEITPSGTTTFTFDADGNRAQQETPAGDLTTLTWDSQNRNIAVELPSLTIVTSVFNSDHNKVQRDDGTDVTNFLWDFKDLILETDDVGATLRHLTYKHPGPPNKRDSKEQQPNEFGKLISQEIASETDTFFHHFDALGSTAALTDSSEVVTDEYSYEASGETTAESGATPNPYQWVAEVGYRKDEETSLYDLRRRNYDPATGRFVSEDSNRSDEENLYRYVKNQPTQKSDPSGLQDYDPFDLYWNRSGKEPSPELIARRFMHFEGVRDKRVIENLVDQLRSSVDLFEKQTESNLRYESAVIANEEKIEVQPPLRYAFDSPGIRAIKAEQQQNYETAWENARTILLEDEEFMSRYVSMPVFENRPESEVVFQREGLAFQFEDNWVQSGEQLVPEAMFAFEEVRRSLELLFTAPVVRPLEFGAFTLSVDLRTGQIMDYRFDYETALQHEVEINTELSEPRVAANFRDSSARYLNPNTDLRGEILGDPMKSAHIPGVPGSQGAKAFLPTATETEAALERTIEKYFGQGVTPREVTEAVGLIAVSLVPGVGEALDIAVLLSKAPWYYKALAGASLLLSVVTLGTSPNFGAAVRTGGEVAQQSGVFHRITTGLRNKLTRRNRLHEARSRYQPERLPGLEAVNDVAMSIVNRSGSNPRPVEWFDQAAVLEDMASSPIGRTVLNAAESNQLRLEFSHSFYRESRIISAKETVTTAGVSFPSGKAKVFLPAAGSNAKAAETAIHEGVHSLGVRGSQRAEVLARAAAELHRKGSLTWTDLNRIYREVKKHQRYLDDPVRIGIRSDIFPRIEF